MMAERSIARDPQFEARTREQVAGLSKRQWYHSIELPDGTVIPGLIGIDALKARIEAFPIPQDLRGKRVLDVGAATGWCSFEMERRGAAVTAVDCVEFQEFLEAHELIGSRVEYLILDVEELDPVVLGRFDYVLFFGVLYHLRNPLLGLERICSLTLEAAFIESFVIDSHSPNQAGGLALLEFYETDELGGQIDNWFGPNLNCLAALCRSAGFARVEQRYVQDRRAGVVCYRRYAPSVPAEGVRAPWITSAVNNRTNDVYFHPGKDEYICVYFDSPEELLKKEDVLVELDGLGVPALLLSKYGAEGWQVNLRVPPGLEPGRHELRLRTAQSPFSNTVLIVYGAEGLPDPVQTAEENQPAPVIYKIENSMCGSDEFFGYKDEYLCCHFRSAERGITKDRVRLEVSGVPAAVKLVARKGEGLWQVNARLPKSLEAGVHEIRIRTLSSPFSDAVAVKVRQSSE